MVAETNANGIIDDYDWIAAIATVPSTDAGHFIGKDVEFCIITDNGYGTQCVLASSFQASDGSACTDSNACVIGGIYYDYPDLSKRGIEPEVTNGTVLGGGLILHNYRPLTIDELEFAEDGTLSWGLTLNGITKAGTHTSMGMDFPLYTHSIPTIASDAVTYCQNFIGLGSGDWHLPTADNTFTTDAYTGAPNMNGAPTVFNQNLGRMASSHIQSSATYDNISPAWGWPLGARYWNAHSAAGQIYETDFTIFGSTGLQADTGNAGQNLVTCVSIQ